MASVRYCATVGCKVRMSAMEKYGHSFCVKCIGQECTVQKRCSECIGWPTEKLQALEKLRKEKARKKAYAERKVAGRTASESSQRSSAHSAAHYLSDSSVDVSQDDGKVVLDSLSPSVTSVLVDQDGKVISSQVLDQLVIDSNQVPSNSIVSVQQPYSVIMSVPSTDSLPPSPPNNQGISGQVMSVLVNLISDKVTREIGARLDKLESSVFVHDESVAPSRLSSAENLVVSVSKVEKELELPKSVVSGEDPAHEDGLLVKALETSCNVVTGESATQGPCPQQSSGKVKVSDKTEFSQVQLENLRTPVQSTYRPRPNRSKDVGSRDSRGSFDMSMSDALRSLIRECPHASEDEKVELMKEHIRKHDPFKLSYSSSRKRQRGDDQVTLDTTREGGILNSTGISCRNSVFKSLSHKDEEVGEIQKEYSASKRPRIEEEACSVSTPKNREVSKSFWKGQGEIVDPVKIMTELGLVQPTEEVRKIVVSKEMGMMIAKGGVTVSPTKDKVKYIYLDDQGLENVVVPLCIASRRRAGKKIGLDGSPVIRGSSAESSHKSCGYKRTSHEPRSHKETGFDESEYLKSPELEGAQLVSEIKKEKEEIKDGVVYQKMIIIRTFKVVQEVQVSPDVSVDKVNASTQTRDEVNELSLTPLNTSVQSAPGVLVYSERYGRKVEESMKVSVEPNIPEVEKGDDSFMNDVEKELDVFQGKSWVELNKKIFSKQPKVEQTPQPDLRSPWQISRNEPMKAKPDARLLNSFIKVTMEDLDAQLAVKRGASAVKSFFPPGLHYKIANQYGTKESPKWSVDAEARTILEGLLVPERVDKWKQLSISLSKVELETLAKCAFRILEILSFMMCAIDVVGDGFEEIASKVSGKDKALVSEYASYMGCVDKAGRHAVTEVSVMLANFILKQRQLFVGTMSFLVPRPIKLLLVCARVWFLHYSFEFFARGTGKV